MEKSKIRTVIGFFFIFTLLIGCNYGSSKKKIIAHKKVDVFETYEGDSLKIIMRISDCAERSDFPAQEERTKDSQSLPEGKPEFILLPLLRRDLLVSLDMW